MSYIKHHKLTHYDVNKIILEWYTEGMFPDILQNEEGKDLEEILLEELDAITTKCELCGKNMSFNLKLKSKICSNKNCPKW